MEVQELLGATKAAFAFLITDGYGLAKEEVSSPHSFKGGFLLTYASPDAELQIRYSDMEVVVTLDGSELFGFQSHGSFAGNMFSRENLLRCVDRIAADVRTGLENVPG